MERAFTESQGQYLEFIYYYTKLHGVPPVEADMQRCFDVSPPSVHNMSVTLERRRLIARTPGAALSTISCRAG
jgi:repressor LexA